VCHFEQGRASRRGRSSGRPWHGGETAAGKSSLAALLQPSRWARLDGHPHQRQVQQRACERQHDQRRQVGKVIGLDHQCWTGLPGVCKATVIRSPRCIGQSIASHASLASASQKAISSRPARLASHSASSRACRAASAAKPGAFGIRYRWTGDHPRGRRVAGGGEVIMKHSAASPPQPAPITHP
jgi:hypothetical protein